MKLPNWNDLELLDADEAKILFPAALSKWRQHVVHNDHRFLGVDDNGVLWRFYIFAGIGLLSSRELTNHDIESAYYWDEAGGTWVPVHKPGMYQQDIGGEVG